MPSGGRSSPAGKNAAMAPPEAAAAGGSLRPPPRLVGGAAAAAMAMAVRTWRLQVEGGAELDRLLEAERRFLLLFWHGKYLPLFPLLAGRRACIFTSRSYRGEIVAEICRRFGYEVRSLPRDAGEARLALRRTLAETSAAATAADGPLGPGRQVKRALIEAAAETGTLLLPVGIGSHPRLVRRRRWDRLEIPLPFARLVLVFGHPRSPPGAGAEVERSAGRLGAELQALERRAEELACGLVEVPL